jgi:tRNA (guanine9-N1)-methyltransferase
LAEYVSRNSWSEAFEAVIPQRKYHDGKRKRRKLQNGEDASPALGDEDGEDSQDEDEEEDGLNAAEQGVEDDKISESQVQPEDTN